MRSLATSEQPFARAVSSVIGLASSKARARDFVRILHRMGADPSAIVPRVRDSPNFHGRRFAATEPALRPRLKAQTSALIAAVRVHGRGRPVGEVPLVKPDLPEGPGALAVTWYGHATTVLELDGARFLLDPVFSERVSPSTQFGPKRLHPTPGPIEDIPTIDAVLISHDHYDHLDEPSIVMLEHTHRPRYVVPLGVDLHLFAWGVPAERITALDWREETEVAGVRLTCTEARHNSGRGLVDSHTLWAGWALHGPEHSAWFTGDSGTSACFARIGADLGPFDLTLVPVGAYDPFWPDIHMDPEQAVAAHRDVNRIGADAGGVVADRAGAADDFIEGEQRIETPGSANSSDDATPDAAETTGRVQTAARESVMLPVHWATFNLAMHWWAEPLRRVRTAAAAAEVPIVSPRIGERVDLTDGSPQEVAARHAEPWWETCSAAEDHD